MYSQEKPWVLNFIEIYICVCNTHRMYREDGEETEKKVHRYELGFLFKEKHFKITFYRLKYDL